jgi:hypothetical protein
VRRCISATAMSTRVHPHEAKTTVAVGIRDGSVMGDRVQKTTGKIFTKLRKTILRSSKGRRVAKPSDPASDRKR